MRVFGDRQCAEIGPNQRQAEQTGYEKAFLGSVNRPATMS